jgi:hypothetical protein
MGFWGLNVSVQSTGLVIILYIMFTRELSTAEESCTEMSHSKSCEGRLEDPLSLLPVMGTAVGNAVGGPNQAPAEPTVHPVVLEFHENHGRNVQLGEGRRMAKRTASYNQGVVISSKPLPREQLFQVTEWAQASLC